jgi:hypothetical protein
VNAYRGDYGNALHAGSAGGHLEVVKLLLGMMQYWRWFSIRAKGKGGLQTSRRLMKQEKVSLKAAF